MKQIEISVPEAVVPYANVEEEKAVLLRNAMLIASDTTPIITLMTLLNFHKIHGIVNIKDSVPGQFLVRVVLYGELE